MASVGPLDSISKILQIDPKCKSILIIITAFIKRHIYPKDCSKALYIKKAKNTKHYKSKTKLKQKKFIKQGNKFKKYKGYKSYNHTVYITARNALINLNTNSKKTSLYSELKR